MSTSPRVRGSDVKDPAVLARVVETVLSSMRKQLGMEVAFISEFRDGRRIFRYVDSDLDVCPIAVGGSDPLDASYCQRVVDGRLPEVIPDATLLPAALELPVTTELPVGAHLSVPIHLSDGSVYGTFCAFSSEPNPTLRDRDASFLHMLASLIADHLEDETKIHAAHRAGVEMIERVLREDAITIVYQPIVDLKTRLLLGLEALSRFSTTPQEPPDWWFAKARTVGLGVELEVAAIAKALAQLPDLPPGAYLSLNVAPATVGSPQLAEALAGAPLDRIVLEITEHDVVKDYALLLTQLRHFREAGLRIAVDDAGAGYASLRHILSVEPDIIKLDRAITSGIDHDHGRQAMAAALRSFCVETGATLVAEGVETAEELAALCSFGIRCGQGYYLGRPALLRESAFAVAT